jgi:hypothetical protein
MESEIQHKFDFESLSKVISERLKQFKGDGDFYICDRIRDNVSFLSLYKDAMFHYIDGIVLCERLFLPESVQFEDQEVIKYSEENKKLYEEFLNFANEANEKEIPQEELSSKIKEYSEKFNGQNNPKETIKIPYYQTIYGAKNKFLLQKLSDIPDDAIDTFGQIIAEYVISFFRSMFFIAEKEYSLTLQSIQNDKYIDIIAIITKQQG